MKREEALIQLRPKRLDGLSVKSGPTESGEVARPISVGGVVVPAVNYVVLGILALFVLWIGFFLFRKRSSVIRFFAPMLLKLMRT